MCNIRVAQGIDCGTMQVRQWNVQSDQTKRRERHSDDCMLCAVSIAVSRFNEYPFTLIPNS